jgi:hypothetical protein
MDAIAQWSEKWSDVDAPSSAADRSVKTRRRA